MTDPEAYALAAWKMLEHAWRTEGTLAALAAGFRPERHDDAPRLTVEDAGRLDRLDQVRAEAVDGTVRLSLPLAVLDVWVDIDDLADALVEAITAAWPASPCDDLDYS